MGMMGFGYLWMLLGFLVFVGILGLVIWAIVQFSGFSRGQASLDSPGAQRILDERYARGEISQEEYQRIRRDIG